MSVNTFLQWYGSDRMQAKAIGQYFSGGRSKFFMVPFCGGMSALKFVKFRTAVVNDEHWFVICLAEVCKNPASKAKLIELLESTPFHAGYLQQSQQWLDVFSRGSTADISPESPQCMAAAYHFFVASWMGRASAVGTANEWKASFAIRYDAAGGDSCLRFRNATESLNEFHELFQRCQFTCQDGIDLVNDRFKDEAGHGLYIDAPWPDDGAQYKHGPDRDSPAAIAAFHGAIRDSVKGIRDATVVIRYNDHPLIQELYPESEWAWRRTGTRTQSNKKKLEVHITRNANTAEKE